MKPLLKLIALFLIGVAAQATAQSIPVNGVDDNGFGGQYDVGPEQSRYWWMCIEPGAPQTAGSGGFLADALSFEDGWSQQNTERYTYYHVDNPGYLTTVVPKQVAVMEYVLDTYLPWTTLNGDAGGFLTKSGDSSLYGTDDEFYNAFFAVQNFLSEMYGKEAQSDFTTDLSVNFVDYFAAQSTDAEIARSAIFQQILDDVQAQDLADLFDTYEAAHLYFIANTSYPLNDPNNFQDALIIVPEPSGALLISCFGLVVLFRRCRRAARAA